MKTRVPITLALVNMLSQHLSAILGIALCSHMRKFQVDIPVRSYPIGLLKTYENRMEKKSA